MTIVIVAFLAAIVALAMTGRDTAALIAVGTAVLAGLGLSLGQQQAVKEQTNGNTTKLLEMVEAQGQMLARMQPPPADQEKPGDGL
jgi:hypothetical protein